MKVCFKAVVSANLGAFRMATLVRVKRLLLALYSGDTVKAISDQLQNNLHKIMSLRNNKLAFLDNPGVLLPVY